MPSSAIALIIVLPFAAIFAYAMWHEWHRARQDGQGTYGLAYDPETDTTHVTLLEEGETSYDPETDATEADAAPDPDAETEPPETPRD